MKERCWVIWWRSKRTQPLNNAIMLKKKRVFVHVSGFDFVIKSESSPSACVCVCVALW